MKLGLRLEKLDAETAMMGLAVGIMIAIVIFLIALIVYACGPFALLLFAVVALCIYLGIVIVQNLDL